MTICRHFAPLVVAMGEILSGAASRGDESENLSRLGSMPLQHRRALVQNLDRFDSLGAADREAIRAIDRELADQPENRARYLAVLRRYHLWLQRLPKEQRDAIAAAPPEERMSLVLKFRREEHNSDVRRRTPLFLQVVDLGDMSPFDVAERLKVWFALTPLEREKLNKMPRSSGPWRAKFFDSLESSWKGEPPRGQFTKPQEEDLVRKMMEVREFRHGLPASISVMLMPVRNFEAKDDRGFRKAEGKSDFGDRPPLSGRNGVGRSGFQQHRRSSIVHCLAGNYHFIVNPPEKVDPSHLFRFLSKLPKGISESFTYLPPEEARRRLTILYRLLYPFPGDMPLSENTSTPSGAPPSESIGKSGPTPPPPARERPELPSS